MAELSLDQQKAMAMASARARAGGAMPSAKVDPRQVPDSPPVGSIKPEPEPSAVDLLRGAPGAILSMASSIPAQIAGRATALVNPAAGRKVAEAMTYQPSERGQQTRDAIGRIVDDTKIAGMGPMSLPAGSAATKVLAGREVPAVVTKAAESGFRLTPSEGKGGILSRVAEGLSGEAKLAKSISQKNAPAVSETILGDLGLPKGSEVKLETIQGARKEAHKPYEAIRGAGEVTTGPEFNAALDKVEKLYQGAAKSFPKLNKNEIKELVDGVRVKAFDASSAVDQIIILREDADKAFAKRENALGKANKALAQAIEDELDRHVAKTGNPDLVKDFRAARQRIAQTYTAEKALDGQGNFDPQVYAKELKKGKKLTGGALEVAEAARQFPRSLGKPAAGNAGAPTMADAILSLLSGGGSVLAHGLSGGAVLPAAAALAARPTTRAALASKPYQAWQGKQFTAGVPIPSPAVLRALQAGPMLPQSNTEAVLDRLQ